MPDGMMPVFFETAAKFRRWLERNHASAAELWVGFHKKGSGRPSMTWPESVDEALCFGWIDGVRRSVDAHGHAIRFTPRKPRSIWSARNLQRVEELIAARRMTRAGLSAWERRSEARSRSYSFEQQAVTLPEAYERELRANAEAWTYFQAQPPYYRRTVTWWVISAKREATRVRRLGILIRDSAAGKRIEPMRKASDG